MTIQDEQLSLHARDISLLVSDSTGSDTFRRYVWQAKQAVLSWLSCLRSGPDAPLAVVCERVEDLIVVYSDHLVFAQLKTKSKGSWSASSVCDKGHGLDSLVRTHLAIVNSSLSHGAVLELWLEGPAAASNSTSKFFTTPRTADAGLRKRIKKLSEKSFNVDEFLGQLRIKAEQPSQASIDAVVLMIIGALWPSMTTPERTALYAVLLAHAEKAQSNELDQNRLHDNLREVIAQPPTHEPQPGLAAIASQSLTRQMLLDLTPPLPDTSRDDILRRINNGGVPSALELKMQAAGARPESITLAQYLRANSDISRLSLLASRTGAETELRHLETKLLRSAEAFSRSAKLHAGGNPAISSQQGEYVMTELLIHPHDLLALDKDQLFAGEADDVLGYLCHLSDACKFWWKSE